MKKLAFGWAMAILASAGGAVREEARGAPVLVELFTSEGCSSCPPADALLERLDGTGAIPGAAVIVLSEHVDYWNHIGWTDPYSSAAFTARQQEYARRFGLGSVYTPQMIVDGVKEFVGNEPGQAISAITAASRQEKIAVRLLRSSGAVRVEVDPLPNSAGRHKAAVCLALAQNSGTSNVAQGENKGRQLHHVAIVRRLEEIGSVGSRAAFTKEVALERLGNLDGMRVVAFVQEAGSGRIWGAAMVGGTP